MTTELVVPSELEREIASEDPAIDELDMEGRRVVGAVYRHRARSEMTAAVVFTEMTGDLFSLGAHPSVTFLAANAVSEEMLHSEVCRRVAERYLGEAVPLPSPRPFEPMRFGDCPESVNRTLRVVLSCCISESIGSAVLSASLSAARARGVRAALRYLLSDEIRHARLGYAHLASPLVDDDQREHVRRALPTLLRVTREAWYGTDAGLPDSPPPGHGCLSRAELHDVVEDAIANLVVPGVSATL